MPTGAARSRKEQTKLPGLPSWFQSHASIKSLAVHRSILLAQHAITGQSSKPSVAFFTGWLKGFPPMGCDGPHSVG